MALVKYTLHYIRERGVNVFGWPGNSADLTTIEEVGNIMKINLVSFQTTRKKLWNNIKVCNLWYGIHRETAKKLYDKMPSMVTAVHMAKMGLPCTQLLQTIA